MQRNKIIKVIEDEIMTASEVAEELKTTRQNLQNLEKKQSLIPAVKKKGVNLYLRQDVEYYTQHKGAVYVEERQKIHNFASTDRAIAYLNDILPDIKNDVTEIALYLTSYDAIMDGVYTTEESPKRNTLTYILPPTCVIRTNTEKDIFLTGINCGYSGTGPGGSYYVLTSMLDIPQKIAEYVYSSRIIKFIRLDNEWQCINTPRNIEEEEYAFHCRPKLFNNTLVVTQDKPNRYLDLSQMDSFLRRELNFIPHPVSAIIYPKELAITTGHIMEDRFESKIYQVVIKDESGRELWIEGVVDEYTSLYGQKSFEQLLTALNFDLEKEYKNPVSKILRLLEKKVTVLNYMNNPLTLKSSNDITGEKA